MTEGSATNGASEDGRDEVLRVNGFLALRSQLNAVAEAVSTQLPPVVAIDAVIMAFEETRDQAPEPIPPEQVDELDTQLALFRMLRSTAAELEQIRERAEARAKLRGNRPGGASVPRGRRGA